jgi:alpha-glucosidase
MIAYIDAADSHWETKPEAYQIKRSEVTAKDKITLTLQPGGGAAIEFIPLK